MLTLDYPTFREVVAKNINVVNTPIYFFEDEEKFVLFWTDDKWKFNTIIGKADLMEFVPHTTLDRNVINFVDEFRNRNLEGAVRVIGYDDIPTPQKTAMPKDEEVADVEDSENPYTPAPKVNELTTEVNEKIQKGEM